MDAITMILMVAFCIPAAISIVGIVFLFTKYKKIGLGLFLTGIVLAGVILLIGNAVCSGIHLGNMN
jgi:chromate transport protein ChrA